MSLARLAYKVLKAPTRTRFLSPMDRLNVLEKDFYLESAVSPVDPWRPPDFTQRAVCGRRSHPGERDAVPPPKAIGKCNCGIHAWNAIDVAINSTCEPYGYFNVCVAVALWGRVRAGQNALRAQRCQIMAVIMPDVVHMKSESNHLFKKYPRSRIIEIIQSNGLPVFDYGEHWHDPQWVRNWAARRNLIPQADMVEADKLLEDLEAS